MCGIVGAWWIDNNSSNSISEKMKTALACLKHRGPNDSGADSFKLPQGELLLGHTRLSIIDLSLAGHQPMHSKDGMYSIVFNGEIYNYKELRQQLELYGYLFETNSDTEVLLAAWQHWGEDSLPMLIGMFAFVVFDSKNNNITCVRDAFGIKPFFYSFEDKNFFFASEIKAIHALRQKKPELNYQQAYDYLVYGNYDDKQQTFFKDIFHILPAHLLTFNLETGEIHKKQWWYPNILEDKTWTFDRAVEQVRYQFLENIKLHLRSDVPVGAALSGGIDSSAIVCAMKYIEPDLPIHTFSYIAKGSLSSEEKWVDLVNHHVKAVSHKVLVTPYELIKDLDSMIISQGEPFGSTSIYAQYKVFQSAKENGIVVTLEGQGADELLAGYNGYPGARLHSLIEQGKFVEAYEFLMTWSEWPNRSKKQALKALISSFSSQEYQTILRYLNGISNVPSWLNENELLKEGVVCQYSKQAYQVKEKSRRVMMELAYALSKKGLPHLLRHGDRNSMAFSIEGRVPFLTLPMVDLLFSLPEDYLISSKGETKHIFREAMKGIVPDEILYRKDKIGFETPELQWFIEVQDELKTWLAEDLGLTFINTPNLMKSFDDILSGKMAFSWQVWRWLNFYRWYKLNF